MSSVYWRDVSIMPTNLHNNHCCSCAYQVGDAFVWTVCLSKRASRACVKPRGFFIKVEVFDTDPKSRNFSREGHRSRRENKWKLDTQDSSTPLRWPLSQGLNIISEVAGEVIPSCVRERERAPPRSRPPTRWAFRHRLFPDEGQKKTIMEDGHRICFASPHRTIGAWRHGRPLNHLSAPTRSKKMLH